jgi:hypothetical protein
MKHYVENKKKVLKEELQSLFLVGNVELSPTNPRASTTLPTAQPKMAIAIFGFGLTHSLQTKTPNLFGNIGKFGKLHLNRRKK